MNGATNGTGGVGRPGASDNLTLHGLQEAFAHGLTPSQLVSRLYPAWAASTGAFVTLVPLEALLQRARELEALPESLRGPLHGVPFGVKDNIDAGGLPTTAACEAFRYVPSRGAPVVDALVAAGGIVVGKTNMDQFAAGLVGTRTPYGVPTCAFDPRFTPGGSSSGSGSLVGRGLLPFALGTDTAGSGRVPAMFNGCVGIKPTVGRLSALGVVPACKSLDCVTVFAQNVADAAAVTRLMQAGPRPPDDPSWAAPTPAADLRLRRGAAFRFAVPGTEFTSFAGPGGDAVAAGYAQLYAQAAKRLETLGGQRVDFDFAPFAMTARMLYETAFIAERYAGIREFLESRSTSQGIKGGGGGDNTKKISSTQGAATAGAAQPLGRDELLADGRMLRVTRAIIAGACGRSAAELYNDLARLTQLKAQARVQMAKVDVLLVPTAAHHYTIPEIASQEEADGKVSWGHNANLGRFTNYVNLLDMAGIALPSGLFTYPAGGDDAAGADRRQYLAATGGPPAALPFGVTLLGQAWSDEYLWDVAAAFAEKTGLGNGPAGHGLHLGGAKA